MEWPKTLLYCDRAPGASGVGQLFLKELCELIPDDKVAFCTLEAATNCRDVGYFSNVERLLLGANISIPRRNGNALASAMFRHFAFRKQMSRMRSGVINKCVKFGEARDVKLVWAILSSPVIWYTAPEIARRLNVPLVSTIWDPPEGVGHLYNLDSISRRFAEKQFFATLKSSERIGVISERMGQEYRELCDASVVLRHGITDSEKQTARTLPVSDELRIGFCGSLYAEDEWMTLLNSLDLLEWKLAGVPVRLVIAGARVPALVARSPAKVEYLGWRPMAEVIQTMSRCHILYLPYWFNPAFSDSVRLCFPTKLTTYLTSGRPVIYHGPSDASVAQFFSQYSIGRCCHSKEASHLSDALTAFSWELISNEDCFSSGINDAIKTELNIDVFHHRFKQLIFGV